MKSTIRYRFSALLAVLVIILLPMFGSSQQLSMLKAERFGGPGWDFVNGVIRQNNGDYIYCGSISDNLPGDTLGLFATSNINAWVAFTDSLGNIIRQKEYNNKGFDTFTSMVAFGNNIFLTGIFQDTLSLDSITISGMAHSSGFIAIMNPQGIVLNTKPVSNPRGCISNIRLAGTHSDNLYLAGTYCDTITIENVQSTSKSGFFITRLDTELNIQAPLFFPAEGNPRLGGLSCNDSSVVIAGVFSDTLSLADTTLISLGKSDAFVAWFNQNLELQHIGLISSPEEVEIKSVALTKQNQTAVAGSFKGSAILADSILTGKGGVDLLAAVWDSTGKLQWVNTAGSIGNDYGWAIAPGNEGDFFVSGSFTHVLAIPGENGEMIELQPEGFFGNTFIAKYDHRGILKATFNLPGTSEDFVSELLINTDNTLAAAGNFFETLLLTAYDSVSYTMESTGSKDIFTLLFKDMCAGYTIDAGPDLYLCPGETIMLEPDFTSSGFKWLPDGLPNTPLEVTQHGSYTLMAMNAYGCIAYDTLHVELIPIPLVFAGNDTIVQPGSPLVLAGAMESGQSPAWTTSGDGYFSPSSGLQTTYYFSNNDISNQSVWLILTAGNECISVSDSLKVDILTDDDGITAFPNPTSNMVTLVREEILPIQNITITKQTGFVLEQNIPVNNFEFTYNLQNQPPGTYLFYITTNAGTSCKVINKL
ncbi:hypothetical protein TBC1_112130 [Lentimicrobium saccharophilum]|uniref:Protein containing Por secretion system C-terminal sorting domain n=1 Tax=Lentimicrobium saccharophilum TaxID=1678841 RepID=A0A0S7C4T5_9BACT|nr:T9SS type A sorting domain-containing protein [Lentimicrobium saccharophilum]GAP43971.1 hypothetical protein TBC1_112130 [Lentimicrobium saccharophilum]